MSLRLQGRLMVQGSGWQHNIAHLFKIARHGRTTVTAKIISKTIGIGHFITVNKAFIAMPFNTLGINSNITAMASAIDFTAALTVTVIKAQCIAFNRIANAFAKAAAFKYRHRRFPCLFGVNNEKVAQSITKPCIDVL